MKTTASNVSLVRGYSIALLCLGLLFILVGATSRPSSRPADLASTLDFMSNVGFLLGIACVVVATLRFARAPAALPATTAISLFLLPSFPIGTALAIYWATSVRSKETIPRSDSERFWFRFTVTLFILGLALLNAALVFNMIVGWNGSADPAFDLFLNTLGLALAAVGLAAIVVGLWRSANLSGGYRATFVFNILLAVWVPFGTALALVWFFVVRKHERQLISDTGTEGRKLSKRGAPEGR